MSEFSHLHVHTEYSILDGLAPIPDLIRKAYKDGQRSMAITDHGNMYGIYTFVKEVENFNKKEAKEGDPFKAIIGCEVYVARNNRLSKSNKEDRSGHHLVLLAKDRIGYRNLSRLVSLAWIEGFYYTPRIDKEILKQYSEGIIACSACLGGELPQAIMNSNPSLHNGDIPIKYNLDAARKVVEEFKSIFGNDYYIEIQRNGHKEQTLVNEALFQLAEEYNIKCIATNDSHFVDKEDFAAHKVLICINTGTKLISEKDVLQDTNQDNGMVYSGEEYFKTTDEMKELFTDHPEVIANTQLIADTIEVIKLKSTPTLPHFEVPKEFKNDNDYLEYLTYEGAKKRWGENLSDEIKERLQFELDTVKGMGYPGYFLIVRDFINSGREQGIRFGPGRGSAAGSAIAYCLNITNIDPIKYDLLFERFLNPDRISLPDMDIDMDDTGREKIIKYVSDKYGKEKVAQIITFGSMAAKSAIRDCARVLNLDLAKSDRIAKLIPATPKITLEKVIKEVPDFKKEMETGEELVQRTIHYALKLEGRVRNTGVHACGVIIGRDNLIDSIPLCSSKNSDTMVTQYEGSLVEDAGLLKMDFLGLKTLNIITSCLDNIKKRFGIDMEIDDIPLDDAKTFDLFSRGDTIAVFQFESDGMRKYLQDLKPTRFEDIIAMVSLYRPGPMDNIPTFIRRKNGLEKIQYPIPEMSKILDDTYGITVYQEQVMLLSRLLADFTRGQADTLRKAMGKKQIKMMEELETKFMYGGTQKGYAAEDLKKIWTEWKKFAEYAFNKSHATCYAFVSYQTAYLKANYTAEFLAANLTNNLDKMDEISKLLSEAAHLKIPILQPDINESYRDFTVNKDGAIRFGLGALKGVGGNSIDDIVAEREKNGNFTDIFNFIERINLRSCNKGAIEKMAATGVFDCFPNMHRAQFFHIEKDGKSFIEKLVGYGTRAQDKAEQMQFSIFDEAPPEEKAAATHPPIPECEKWASFEQLKHEKEIAGFYISGHPLDPYKPIINNYTNTSLTIIGNKDNWEHLVNRSLTFIGMITDAQKRTSKNGNEYGIITLEDYESSFEWMLFGEEYSKFKHLMEKDKYLFVKAHITERIFTSKDGVKPVNYSLKPIDIFFLSDAYKKLCKSVRLNIDIVDVSENLAYIILETARQAQGKVPLILSIVAQGKEFQSNYYNYEIKIDPENFIKLLPPLRCQIKLE